MTRARVQVLRDKVNSLLTMLDIDAPLDGMLPHASVLCILSYDPTGATQAEGYGTDGFVKMRGEDGVSRAPAVLPLAPPVLPLATGSDRHRLPQLPATTAEPLELDAQNQHRHRYYRWGPTGTTGASGTNDSC